MRSSRNRTRYRDVQEKFFLQKTKSRRETHVGEADGRPITQTRAVYPDWAHSDWGRWLACHSGRDGDSGDLPSVALRTPKVVPIRCPKGTPMVLPQNRPHSADLTPEQMRQGIRRLGHRIAEVEAFQRNLTPDEIEQVHRRVFSTLAKVFGADTNEFRRYAMAAARCRQKLARHSQMLDPIEPLIQYRGGLLAVLNEALSFLTEELDVMTSSIPYLRMRLADDQSTATVPGRKVFIVHGTIARHGMRLRGSLEMLALSPSFSKSSPAKAERSSRSSRRVPREVGFAVVLMTPDDTVVEPASAVRARQTRLEHLIFVTD
jgi:hypothetical protein